MKKRLFKKLSIVWITIFSFYSSISFAQNIEQVDELAEHYRSVGEYEQAEASYHRIICFGNKQDRSKAMQKLGNLYLETGKKQQSVHYYRKALTTNPDNTDLFFNYCFALLSSENYDIALTELAAFPYKKKSKERYLLFKGMAHFYNGDNTESKLCLDSLTNIICPKTKGKVDSIFAHSKHKNINVAQLLSAVIPGSGQIYAGDWKNGGKALMLNGALIALTAYIGIEYGVLQTAFSAFPRFFRYYTSNILNAAKSAEKKNSEYKSQETGILLKTLKECESIKNS